MNTSVSPETQTSLSTDIISIDWAEISRVMLQKSLMVNPLATQPNELKQEDTAPSISIEQIETEGLQLKRKNQSKIYSTEKLFEIIKQQEKSKTLIIGRPGSGKTLLMQRIANLVLQKTEDVVIWIPLGELSKDTIEDYLAHKWLKWASKAPNGPSQMWSQAFSTLLASGKVWLFLDDSQELFNTAARDLFNNNFKEIITPLNIINKELKGWTKNLRIILSSRSNLWEKDQDRLSEWPTYQIKPLTYPQETTAFIRHWFNATNSELTSGQEREHHSRQFSHFLEELSPLTPKEWQSNPLHLALLCRHWQQVAEPDLKNISQLYEKAVNQYYQWKAGTVTTPTPQREQLNQYLAQLALITLEEQGSLQEIPQSYYSRIFQNEPHLGQLALGLGWLNLIRLEKDGEVEKVYQFFDQTFAEYFASLEIREWQYFIQNQAEKNLRIFDPAWEQVILFWLGSSEAEEKKAFIEYLTEFKDGCGKFNYYGKRAYFLAAKALVEYPESDRALLIISQLLKWAFSDSQMLTGGIVEKARTTLESLPGNKSMKSLMHFLKLKTEDSKTHRIALKILEKIAKGHPLVIAMLSDLIDTTHSDDLREQYAESLLRISPTHDKAVTTLLQILQETQSEEIRQNTFSALEKLAQGNVKAINTIHKLINETPSSLSQKRLFQCLEKIGKYQSPAIAALVQMIRTTEDPVKQRQAAESLEKIDPGNPTALAVLTQLMQPTYTEALRQEAIYSLGEIESVHPEVITALIKQIQNAPQILIRWLAISSLGKIAQGNQECVDVLTEVIDSAEDNLLRKEAIDSLLKIAPHSNSTVCTLLKLLETAPDEETRREVAESLGKIDPGNPEAIIALTELLKTTLDDYTRRQVAFSLSQIDPGNLQALSTLIQLAHSGQDRDLSILAIDSLGETSLNNPAIITTLIGVISSHPQPQIIRSAVKSLGKIKAGSTEAVETLLKLLEIIQEKSLRHQIAESLIKLLRPQDLVLVAKQIPSLAQSSGHKEDTAIGQITWYCAQNLAYAEFYQAWHNSQEKPKLENIQPINLQQLKEKLKNSLKQDNYLIWIDTAEFLDPEDPALDIYDQMLAQDCPEFAHGLPETMVKLRLYWHNLKRQKIKSKTPVLLFYGQEENKALQATLNKFKGAVGIITLSPACSTLPSSFSLQDQVILTSILNWLKQKAIEKDEKMSK